MLAREADEGHVERAAAEVVDEDGLLLVGAQRQGRRCPVQWPGRLEGVGQGGGGRLVEDVEDIETGDPARVLGRLAARVVEVSRDRDDRAGDRPDSHLGVQHQLAKDDRRECLRAEVASVDRSADRGVAHVPFDEDGDTLGLLERHVEGGLAHDCCPVVHEQDGAGREHVVIAIGQRERLAVVVQRRDGREGRAEIDADQVARHARGSLHSGRRMGECSLF